MDFIVRGEFFAALAQFERGLIRERTQAGLKAAIVLCPYKHLVDQWAKEARNFNFAPLIVHTSRDLWSDDLNRKLLTLQTSEDEMLLVLTTNQSFAHEFFQSKLDHFPKKTVIVADEAHNLGAKDLRQKLPPNIPWRLALSATPERWFDEEGTDAEGETEDGSGERLVRLLSEASSRLFWTDASNASFALEDEVVAILGGTFSVGVLRF